MVLLPPSASRRAAAATPTARRTQGQSRIVRLRSRFRAVHPRVIERIVRARGGSIARGPVTSPSGIMVVIEISSSIVTRRIGATYIGAEKLDRWAHITAGQVPEGDPDAPRIMSDNDLQAEEEERIGQVEAAARIQEDTVREDAAHERAMHLARADELDAAADLAKGPVAGGLRRRANTARDRADDVMRDAQRELDRIADGVREERTLIRGELTRIAETQLDTEHEYVKSLSARLPKEINDAVQSAYLADGDVVQWEFF